MTDRLAALATLLGGSPTEATTNTLASLVCGPDAALQRDISGALRDTLSDPATAQDIGPVQPDLLGDHLVQGVFEGRPALLDHVLALGTEPDGFDEDRWSHQARVIDVLSRGSAGDPQAGDLLSRAVHHWLDDLDAIRDPLGISLAVGFELAGDVDAAWRIASISDGHGSRLDVRLLELSTVAYRLLLPHAESDEERTRLLNNLSVDLGRLGRYEEALTASEEAAAFYRQLSETRPEAFLPDLARALWTNAQALADLGRATEAVAATAEAMERLLPQAARWPATLVPLLRALRALHLEIAEDGSVEPATDVLEAVEAVLANAGDEE